MSDSSISPPPIPGIEFPRRSPKFSGATPLQVSDIIGNLPSSIETWSYSHVTTFIVQLLSLPRALEVDIRDFITSRKINGEKLVKLDEVQLTRLGFNKLWCHHLSAAIEDLTGRGGLCESPLEMPPPSPDYKMRRGHRAQASIDSIKKFGSFPRPPNIDLETGHPNKSFSLPKVEMTLVRHYMISETAGLKEELSRLKRDLKRSAAMLIPSIEATSGYFSLKGVEGNDESDRRADEESWYGCTSRALAVTTLIAALGIIGFFSLRSRPRK